MATYISDKARAGLQAVLERFESGDLGPVIEVIKTLPPDNAPSRKWSINNRVIAAIQSGGCMDCRGYQQWKEVGRQVRADTHGVYIWGPKNVKKVDEETKEEKFILTGFRTIAVHPYGNTDPIPGQEETALTYQPRELPPLADIAQALGIEMKYEPLLAAYGSCKPDGSRVRLSTEDAFVFYHELAHAIHARIEKLKGGQDPHQETVAEFTAAVLSELYGPGDVTGSAWKYIQAYNPERPMDAIKEAMKTVEKVVAYIESVQGGANENS